MTMLSRNWIEPQVARGTTRASTFRTLQSRAACRIVATAKQVYPAIIVLTGCMTLVAATIALRLLIWLPVYLRH